MEVLPDDEDDGITDAYRDVCCLPPELTRPNGVMFSHDYKKLYVSNSDEADPHWLVLDIDESGNVTSSKRWLSAFPFQMNGTRSGNPDGMKVTKEGTIFAAGPGGVLVLTPEGKHLGTILTGKPTANLAFGDDGYLYITAADTFQRVKVTADPVCLPSPTCSKM